MRKLKAQKPKGGGKIKPPESPTFTESPTPVFCLHFLQGKYCITACQDDDKVAFTNTLYQLSQRTWSEISQLDRHKRGFEHLPQNAIKIGSFPSIVTPDVSLIAFRYSGLKSMVGFRNRSVFHILWIDHDRSLYDHG